MRIREKVRGELPPLAGEDSHPMAASTRVARLTRPPYYIVGETARFGCERNARCSEGVSSIPLSFANRTSARKEVSG